MTDESADAGEQPKKKRKKTTSPTARTLAECRKRGWHAQVVERRIPKSFVTLDLFGCIDIIAITDNGILAIQATSGSNHASRMTKSFEEPRLRAWLGAGGRFEVWSWAQQGASGTRKLWTLRVEPIVMADYEQEAAA